MVYNIISFVELFGVDSKGLAGESEGGWFVISVLNLNYFVLSKKSYSIHVWPILPRHKDLVRLIRSANSVEAIGFRTALCIELCKVVHSYNLPINWVNGNQNVLVPDIGKD